MRSKAILVALLAFAFTAQAAPVSERQARLAARAWAAASGRFGAPLGSSVEQVREFALTNGTSFFTVKLDGGGAVIVSGDSEDTPIVAMSSVDISNPEVGSPLREFLERDMAARRKSVRSAKTARDATHLWKRLILEGEALDMAGETHVPSSSVEPADMRVPALVKSKWNQDGHGENYYTPPYQPGDSRNYVCGCVATAMAQIMRYHEFPVGDIPPFVNSACSVDGRVTPAVAKGGPYDWENMPLVPSTGLSNVEKEAIGRLTYDCGVAVGMDWGRGGSGAVTANVGDALKDRFKYANAKVSTDDESQGVSTDEAYRERLIYASLDAGFPVQLGINKDGKAGHSVVADGYGYIDDVSYVHLNMGWSGQGDIWYHLPNITYVATAGGTEYEADTVRSCVYNIFPDQTGVIISGRTLDDEGDVIAGAPVSVCLAGETEPFTNVVSSAYGVYAVIVPADSEYVVSATYGTYSGDADASVGDGNVWGCDIVISAPSVRVISFDGAETNIWSSLDRALRDATTFFLPTLEIFAPTLLKRNVTVEEPCTIVAGPELEGPAQVERRNGAAITVDDTTVTFSDILFSEASETPVRAVNGGIAAFEGVTSVSETLSVEADAPGGFALSGDIYGGVQVRVDGAMEEGDVFGVAFCDLETAQANAAKIINPDDSSLGGEAFEDEATGDVLFRWAEVPVDPDAAIAASRVDGGEWNYYRTFDEALVDDAAEVVLYRKSRFAKQFTASAPVSISSENGAVLKVHPSAQIIAKPGAEIELSDIVMSGGASLSGPLVMVDGGTVEMKSGAAFEDIAVKNADSTYGLVVVKSGTFAMESGTSLARCSATSPGNANSSGCKGGGVYVYPEATFDMRGGTISECSAELSGGGVFVDNGATLLLSGDATIVSNAVGGVENDVSYRPNSSLLVAGPMTGKVGVLGPSNASNGDGAVFANGASGVSQADLEASADAFFSTAAAILGKVRSAVVDGNSLKWSVDDAPQGPFPVTPAYDDGGFITNAVARVIRSGGAVDYWATISDAFLSLDGDAEIELLDDDFFDEDIGVEYNVVLRSATDTQYGADYFAYVSRTGESAIYVGEGASLVVDGVGFLGNYTDPLTGESLDGSGRLFDVNGGDFSLQASLIAYVNGSEDRAAAAIVVHGGGTATLDDGTLIFGCENSFVDTDTNSGAASGIVAEDEGTAVYLRDCDIVYCRSRKTGGVFIGNKASIYISGNANVVDNFCDDDNSCGNMVVADGAHLYLDGELTGFIGCEEGIGGDQIVFGTVTCPLTAAVIASATNFVHDVTRARGSVSGTDLVWDLEGRTPVAKPVPLGTEFTYDKTLHVVFNEGEGYTVYDASATDAGEYHAVARLEPGCVWEDGTCDAVVCDWTISKAILSVVAANASKIEGEDDPALFKYSVHGLADGDYAGNVFLAILVRDPGEEPGKYVIALGLYALNPEYANNYSFDPDAGFTPGIFTIIDSESEVLPPISEGADLDEILAALTQSRVTDQRVIDAVTAYYTADPEAARTAYNKFRTWAKVTVGDAAAVCSSEQAWTSYEFGASELFENTPTVTITSIKIEDPSVAAMRVTLVVKDGDVEKDVDPESVAALFEMSTDFKVWSKDLQAVANEDGSFTVKPTDPTLKIAVIRLKY